MQKEAKFVSFYDFSTDLSPKSAQIFLKHSLREHFVHVPETLLLWTLLAHVYIQFVGPIRSREQQNQMSVGNLYTRILTYSLVSGISLLQYCVKSSHFRRLADTFVSCKRYRSTTS